MGRSTERHTCADTVLKGDIHIQICHQKDGHTGIQIHHKKNGHMHMHIHPMWKGWTHKNAYTPVHSQITNTRMLTPNHCQKDGHINTQPFAKRWTHTPTTILKKMDTNPNPVLKGRIHTCIHYQKDGSAHAYTSIQCKIDGDTHVCTHQCQTEGGHVCMPLFTVKKVDRYHI